MNRAGYSTDCDGWSLIRWRGAVASGLRGKRGQAFLRELLTALDAMPEKKLIARSFSTVGGYCTLGVIGAARGALLPDIDTLDDWDEEAPRKLAAKALNISPAVAAEIMYENDEGAWYDETPEQRWARMRAWVVENIHEES